LDKAYKHQTYHGEATDKSRKLEKRKPALSARQVFFFQKRLPGN
jgi:hypothetical protein